MQYNNLNNNNNNNRYEYMCIEWTVVNPKENSLRFDKNE